MKEPATIKINKYIVYNADDVYKYDQLYFNGCARTRNIIINKKLTDDDYIFGYIKKDEWVLSNNKYAKAKLLLTKQWVKANVPKFMNNNKKNADKKNADEKNADEKNDDEKNDDEKNDDEKNDDETNDDEKNDDEKNDDEKNDDEKNDDETNDDEPNNDIKNKYEYEGAPPILHLTHDEKFKDKHGNTLDIEVRGERDPNKCYFRVKDVSDGFKLKNLRIVINKNYESNIDYKNFICLSQNSVLKQTSKKYMFLTYDGILKVLFTSRTGNAKAFQSWAKEKLFTVQMGSEQAKKNMAAGLIGVSPQAVKAVFDTNSSKTPTVYLFYIGNANKLLDTNKYDKDDILCKYGCTDDLVRRTNEHTKHYKKEFNKDIELLCFSIIEDKFIFDAESNIKSFFCAQSIEYKKTKELIVINKKNLPNIKKYYAFIQDSYIGHFKELNDKVNKLEKELKDEKHKNELINEKHKNELAMKDKDIELAMKNKDIELKDEKHKNELKDKDIEIFKYRLLLLEKKEKGKKRR